MALKISMLQMYLIKMMGNNKYVHQAELKWKNECNGQD